MRTSIKNKKNLIIIVCVVAIVLVAISIALVEIIRNKDEQRTIVENEIISEEQLEQNTSLESIGVVKEEPQVIEEFFEIETKYCNLYFPEKWKDSIDIRDKEEMGYKVGFYGIVENKEAQLLFEVCFNSDDGELLGYLEMEENIVNISIDINDIVFDDSWEEGEINQIFAMQEEMNFVIDTLNMNENYVIPN